MVNQKYVIVQTYLKDASFENPLFLDLAQKTSAGEKPEVKFNLEVHARAGNDRHFEVTISITLGVVSQEKEYVKCDLKFAALVKVDNEEGEERILFVDVPHQVYPDLRPFVAQIFQMGGVNTSFKLPIIDFEKIFEDRKKNEQEQKAN